MGTVYSGVQHYFRILQFRYGGEEYGEMMIFPLHCYSTAAMPYMGAQGWGNSRRSPLSGNFFPSGFFFTLWGPFFHVVGLFLLVGAISRGPYLHVGAFVLFREEWGWVVSRGGDFWNCPSLNIPYVLFQ